MYVRDLQQDGNRLPAHTLKERAHMAKAKKKSKAKPKTKAKAKAKPKTKAKAKPKAKPRPRAKAKPRTAARSVAGGIPITVTPNVCSNFTANTSDSVFWQQIPTAGCQITKGVTPWPFNVPYPISLTPVSNTRVTVVAGSGTYQILVSCCSSDAPKVVTVP